MSPFTIDWRSIGQIWCFLLILMGIMITISGKEK